jgi:simple sugar transport system permease protein
MPELEITAPTSTSQSEVERLVSSSALDRLLRRPELGSGGGLLLVLLVFAVVADRNMFSALGIVNWVTVSGQLGLVAIGACLLMIAGEFDLSVGSMIGFSGMVMVLLFKFAMLPAWACILLGFATALAIGCLIGMLVVRSGLPSFIVSLAFLFALRGATLVAARVVSGSTQVGGVGDAKNDDALAWLFGGRAGHFLFEWLANIGVVPRLSNGEPAVAGIPMIVVWCLVVGTIAAFVLTRTRFGNWVFAAGGDPKAARSAGIPTNRVKIQLFMFSAFCAAAFGAAQVFDFGSADGNRGQL